MAEKIRAQVELDVTERGSSQAKSRVINNLLKPMQMFNREIERAQQSVKLLQYRMKAMTTGAFYNPRKVSTSFSRSAITPQFTLPKEWRAERVYARYKPQIQAALQPANMPAEMNAAGEVTSMSEAAAGRFARLMQAASIAGKVTAQSMKLIRSASVITFRVVTQSTTLAARALGVFKQGMVTAGRSVITALKPTMSLLRLIPKLLFSAFAIPIKTAVMPFSKAMSVLLYPVRKVTGAISSMWRVIGEMMPGIGGLTSKTNALDEEWNTMRAQARNTYLALRPFQSAIQGVSMGMSIATGNVRGLLFNLLFMGWGIPSIITAVAALTAAIGAFTKAVGQANEATQTMIQLKYMYNKSTEAAQTAMASAEKWAMRYGRSVSDVTQALFTYTRAGVMFKKMTKTMMLSATNMAAATGTTMAQAAQVITTAIGTTKGNVESLRQYGIYLNAAAVNSMDRVKRAAVVTDAVMKRFGGAAHDYASTVSGEFQRIKSSIQSALSALGAPVMNQVIIPILNAMANFTAQMALLARAIWHNRTVVKFWTGTLALAKKTVQEFKPELHMLGYIIKVVLIGAFWAFQIELRIIVYLFRFFLMLVEGLRKSLRWLGRELKPLTSMFGMLAGGMKQISFSGIVTKAKEFAYNLPGQLHKAYNWAKKQWQNIKKLFKEKVQPKLEITWRLFKGNIWEPIKEGFQVGWENFKAHWSKAWDEIKKHAKNIWRKLWPETKSGISEWLTNIWTKVNTWLANTDLGQKLKEWIEKGFGVLSSIVDWIAERFADIDRAADDGWAGVGKLFKLWGKLIWASAKNGFKTGVRIAWAALKAGIVKLWNTAKGFVQSTIIPRTKQLVHSIWEAVNEQTTKDSAYGTVRTKSTMERIKDAIMSPLVKLRSWLKTNAPTTYYGLSQIWLGFKKIARGAKSVYEGFKKLYGGGGGATGHNLLKFLDAVFGAALTLVGGILQLAGDILYLVGQIFKLKAALDNVTHAIVSFGVNAAASFVHFVERVGEIISSLPGKIIDWITGSGSEYQRGGEIVSSNILFGVGNLPSGVHGILQNILDTISNFITTNIAQLQQDGTDIKNAITSTFSNLGNDAWNIMQNAYDTIAVWITNNVANLSGQGSRIASAIKYGIHSLVDAMPGLMDNAANAIASWVTDSTRLLKGLGWSVYYWLSKGWTFAKDEWNFIWSSLSNWITEKAQSIYQFGQNLAWKIIAGMKDSFNYFWRHFGFGDGGGGGGGGGGSDDDKNKKKQQPTQPEQTTPAQPVVHHGLHHTHVTHHTPYGAFEHHRRIAGWFASGLDTVVTQPTLIGVGEAGAERVTVTPLSKPTRRGVEIHVHLTNATIVGTEGIEELADMISKHIARKVVQDIGIGWV